MMRVPCYAAPSEIDGVGCFTTVDIEEGQLVWEFDPDFDRELTREQVGRAVAEERFFLQHHCWQNPATGTVLVCLDVGSYVNHSDTPNTRMSPDGLRSYATRRIPAKTEVTADYSELPFWSEPD